MNNVNVKVVLASVLLGLCTLNVMAFEQSQATTLPTGSTQLPSEATRIYVDKKDPYFMIKEVPCSFAYLDQLSSKSNILAIIFMVLVLNIHLDTN